MKYSLMPTFIEYSRNEMLDDWLCVMNFLSAGEIYL